MTLRCVHWTSLFSSNGQRGVGASLSPPKGPLIRSALGLTGDRGFAGSRTILGMPIVNADRARTEGPDLKQTTRHHDVLEKVDHLILVGEVAVELKRCR